MRIDFIDNMKALGILLVIIGHLSFLLNDSLIILIYAFHMPLFFFISGFLIGDRLSRFKVKKFINYCQNSYVKPYFIFFIISLFFYLLAVYMKGELGSLNFGTFTSTSKGLFWATADSLNVNAVLWFFSAALATLVIAFLFNKLLSDYQYEKYLILALLALICFAGTPLTNNDVPWNIAIVHVCLFFFILGSLSKEFLLATSSLNKNIYQWVVFFVLLPLCIYSCLYNGRVDLASGTLGKSNILFIINAVGFIFCTFFVASSFSATKATQWLSLRSLVIFPLHVFAIQILTMLIRPNFEYFTLTYSIFFIVLYVTTSLVFSFLACKLLNKTVPSIIK